LLPRPALVDRLLDVLLHLVLNRLHRLVYRLLHRWPGQPEPLLHLLPHGLGDLPLEVPKDGLDGLPNLVL